MFKKLSNSEYKYRLKVINRHHLNKENQRIIDKQANLNKIMEQCTISINNFAEVIKNVL